MRPASGHYAYPPPAGRATRAGLAIPIREGSINYTRTVASPDTEVPMSERGSASLFEVVFYCVALVAFMIWSFRHVEFPW